eukprot:scaffold71229_cov29-Prasinocladus_malaysianus.AAC.2
MSLKRRLMLTKPDPGCDSRATYDLLPRQGPLKDFIKPPLAIHLINMSKLISKYQRMRRALLTMPMKWVADKAIFFRA